MGAGNLLRCPHGREMLGPEARLWPVASDVGNAKRGIREGGQAQGGPNDLPSPFSEAPIDLDHITPVCFPIPRS